MKARPLQTTVLSAALLGLLGGAIVVENVAMAQSASVRERTKARNESRNSSKPVEKYPEASRKSPDAKGSAKVQKDVNKVIASYNDEKFEEARTAADAVLANSAANPYDKALASQIAGISAAQLDDEAAAETYLKQAIAADALENNSHFDSMLQLADIQLRKDNKTEGLATIDRYFTESKAANAEAYMLRGQARYEAERFPEAIQDIKRALELKPDAPASWNQLLLAAYSETGQKGEAIAIAEASAAKAPDDVRVQLNLANTYVQAEQNEKAVAILEKLRAQGKITEEQDYRNMYAIYLGSGGKEAEAAAVIEDGLAKGILKPEHQTYVSLAQAYYFAEPSQEAKAIEAYRKAAPLAPDGETYLNLSKALLNAGRVPEAREAAKQALAKGVKNPQEATRISTTKG